MCKRQHPIIIQNNLSSMSRAPSPGSSMRSRRPNSRRSLRQIEFRRFVIRQRGTFFIKFAQMGRAIVAPLSHAHGVEVDVMIHHLPSNR